MLYNDVLVAIALVVVACVVGLGFFIIREGLKNNELTKYSPNVNILYHPSLIDNNVNALNGFASPIYYKPKSYKYGNRLYVPNYTDSVYFGSLEKDPQYAYVNVV